MKIEVRMLTSMSGDPTCSYGDTIKVDAKTAERWEQQGVCEVVRQSPRARSEKTVSKKSKNET